MLAEDTEDSRGFSSGGRRREGRLTISATTRLITHVASLAYAPAETRSGMLAGKGISDAQEGFSSRIPQDGGRRSCRGFPTWRRGMRQRGGGLPLLPPRGVGAGSRGEA